MWATTPMPGAEAVTTADGTALLCAITPLQASLSVGSAGTYPDRPKPHHPITCDGDLRYLDDGTFTCPHTAVPPEDIRTNLCLDHSVALLLVELARNL